MLFVLVVVSFFVVVLFGWLSPFWCLFGVLVVFGV